MLETIISEWIRCINEHYRMNSDESDIYGKAVPYIDNQLEYDMTEFLKANEALVQKQEISSIIQSHPQAYYISRRFSELLDKYESVIYSTVIPDNTFEY
ncbi:uncharacterized protein OCT59_024125 [Rhizophagus irregularis]|nr:hypothetical protein OCT59_024125 [Rhizophagus irregularis]CAB4396090.1 unnamed protein product [Rhizophagus irregularis]CAB4479922.1 unnamed protein product [Rhizophagus irregularis]CAB5377741.1 unnamed protein product [Rhizophagus irregularis]